MRKGLLFTLLMSLCLVFAACGGEKKVDEPAPVTEAAAAPVVDGSGILLAKEILGAFDDMVAKAVELSAAKPDPAELKPKLEEIYAPCRDKMSELNGRYLALKDSDIAQFGACNGYLGENRGKHVFKKDNDIAQIVSHYNFQVGDQEVVRLLSVVPVEILDIAVNQNQDPQ